jgi:uncharacterized membrane protein
MRIECLIFLVSLLLSGSAAATGAFTSFATPNTAVTALSPDGEYAAAVAQSVFDVGCTRWKRADGSEEAIPELSNCGGINADGTIAGTIAVDGGQSGGGHDAAALAIVGTAEPIALPLLAGIENAQARGVSADGDTVVGIAIAADQTTAKAFAWTSAGGTVELPVDSGNSAANGVSPDGSTAFGWADEPTLHERRAVIWQNGVPFYPKDAQDRFLGEALAISANARFVVGTGYLTDDDRSVAWRWDATTGDVTPLPGLQYAGAVTDDGAVVTGDTGFTANRILMVWTADAGAQTLSDYVAARDIVKPAGWLILAGTLNGVSSDGSTIAGCCGAETSDFSLRSFVVTGLLDPPNRLFRGDFEPVLSAQPIVDAGFEATTISGGANPDWEGLDTNPDAVAPDGGTPTCFYSATFGGIATHRGLWSVFFGGWLNGEAETQDFSQSVVLPANVPLYVNYWRLAAQLPDAGTLTVSIDGEAIASTDLAALPDVDIDFVPQSVDIGEYADGGAHVLRIAYAYPGGPNDGFIYVDDVEVATAPVAAGAAHRETRVAPATWPVRKGGH